MLKIKKNSRFSSVTHSTPYCHQSQWFSNVSHRALDSKSYSADPIHKENSIHKEDDISGLLQRLNQVGKEQGSKVSTYSTITRRETLFEIQY